MESVLREPRDRDAYARALDRHSPRHSSTTHSVKIQYGIPNSNGLCLGDDRRGERAAPTQGSFEKKKNAEIRFFLKTQDAPALTLSLSLSESGCFFRSGERRAIERRGLFSRKWREQGRVRFLDSNERCRLRVFSLGVVFGEEEEEEGEEGEGDEGEEEDGGNK